MAEPISQTEVIDRMLGGKRTDAQIRMDGARVVLSQIAELRRRLDLCEKSARHVAVTGQEQKVDGRRWRGAQLASDTLFEGVVDE